MCSTKKNMLLEDRLFPLIEFSTFISQTYFLGNNFESEVKKIPLVIELQKCGLSF